MKENSKLMAALVVASAVLSLSSTGQAFTSVKTQTLSASATIGGGSAAMSVALFNITGNTTAGSVGWTSPAAGSSWTEADQYVQIVSTLTTTGAGIQTYTDNTSPTASPKYTGTLSSTTAAGLVNTASTTQTIPLAWQIVAQGKSPVAPDDPNNVVAPHTGYAWFYYADKAGGLLANAPGNFYIQMENAGSPPQIQFAQSSFGAGSPNGINNVYLESNFQNALGGSSYGTNTITVELFTL